MKARVTEATEFRNREHLFADRFEAGRLLAEMLAPKYAGAKDALVLAIPAGGVPVGIEITKRLGIDLDLIMVRKIQIPGNTEAGFGAMTIEGHVFLNDELLARLDLSPRQIESQKAIVEKDLQERNRLFRGGEPFADVSGKVVILADDGLASGFTMMASVHTVRDKGAEKIVVAIPTAPLRSIERIEHLVEEIYCPNVRVTPFFAVANAYKNWHDLERGDVLRLVGRA